MRSRQIVEFGAPLQEVERETPQPQGTEVLVRVRACGVCHSDIHLWEGYFDLGDGQKIVVKERGLVPPFTLGHEIVGEVAAVGPDASGAEIGDRRLVFPWIGCGSCESCAKGVENLCPDPRYLGTRRDGGYSDYVMVPHPRYLLDYTGLAEDVACLYTCSGITAYSALKKVTPLGDRDRLLIIGAGGLGLMALRLAKAVTGAEVIVADIDKTRLAAAREAGAADVIDTRADDASKRAIELSQGGFRAAIDFVGAPSSARFGFDGLRRGGKLVSVGLFGGTLHLPLPLLPLKTLSIVGSYVGILAELRELLDLVRESHVEPIPVTARPLDQATESLEDLRAGRVIGRIVLHP